MTTDTPTSLNWRMSAACAGADPEAMYPAPSDAPAVANAKTICKGCHVVSDCLASALAEEGKWAKHGRHGVRGGLTGTERADLCPPRTPARTPRATPRPAAGKRTLAAVFEEHTVPTFGGHLEWNGPRQVTVDGVLYPPRRLAFILDRGTQPDGLVLNDCGRKDCVLAAHVADAAERQACGTRPGYQRHIRDRTTPCTPCRQANTDADRRLRNTGTTLAA